MPGDVRLIRTIRDEISTLVADIDEMLVPDYDKPRASVEELTAFAAREWKNVVAYDHALGNDVHKSASRSAAYAIRILPLITAMTPQRFFEWFAVATLADSNGFLSGLCALNLDVFIESGAIVSPLATEQARLWQRLFGRTVKAMSVPVEPDASHVDVDTAADLSSLWRATSACIAKIPDDLEAAVEERSRIFQRRYSGTDERLLPEALLDYSLSALIVWSRGNGLRVPVRSPYVHEVR
jgi:hypothetical protein